MLQKGAEIVGKIMRSPVGDAAVAAGVESLVGKGLDNLSKDGNGSNTVAGASLAAALGAGAVELKKFLLNESANADDPAVQGYLNALSGKIESSVTRGELDQMWREFDSRLTEYETRLSEQNYRIHALEEDSKRNAANIDRNTALIERAQARIRELQEEMRESIEDLNIELEGIRQGIAVFRAEFADEQQRTRAVERYFDSRVTTLEKLITPKTAGQTASVLGADAAKMLINNQDPGEAKKLLLLSIAYDKRANKHADPGARYFLALAYRRLGDNVRAEEWLMEGVFAERFRETPDWFKRASEWFQGPDRNWLHATRRNPRFGVRAPRRVSTLTPLEISLPTNRRP